MDYTFLVVVAAVPVMIAAQVYQLVLKMSTPEKMMRPLTEGLTGYEEQVIVGHKDWLASLNLQYLTSYQFGAIRVAVFQQQNTQRFVSFYFHKQTTFDLETWFDDSTTLTTATSGSIGAFPLRPGAYKQGFPNAAVDEAWRRHLEAEEYLVKKFGLVTRPLSQPYLELLLNSVRSGMQYVRSIPLWPFMAIYWHLVTRGRMANRTIQQQFP